MLRICSRSAEISEMESSSAAINILKPEEQSAQLACQLFFADYDLSGHGITRLETLRQQAPCRVIPRHGPLQFAGRLFFADRDLSGHGTAYAGDRNQDDYPERCVRIGPCFTQPWPPQS